MKNDTTLTIAARTALRVLAVMTFVLGIVVALPGCGGGDWPEDERATTGPVDCKATPELCK